MDVCMGLRPTDEIPSSMTKYVEDMRERLRYAYDQASKAIGKTASSSKQRYDRRVRDAVLSIGDRVLVKNVNLRGKTKIADRWEQEPYRVLSIPNPDLPVYVVKQEHSGKERTLHRNLLKHCYDSPRPTPVSLAEPKPRPSRKLRVKREVPRAATPEEWSSDSDGEYMMGALDPKVDPFSPRICSPKVERQPEPEVIEVMDDNTDEVRVVSQSEQPESSVVEIESTRERTSASEVNEVPHVEAEATVMPTSPREAESSEESAKDETDDSEGPAESEADEFFDTREEPRPLFVRKSKRVRRAPQRYGWSQGCSQQTDHKQKHHPGDDDTLVKTLLGVISKLYERKM
ncbi:uncharacterized protein LOC144350093 [Saccoglossus kowalevskii]